MVAQTLDAAAENPGAALKEFVAPSDRAERPVRYGRRPWTQAAEAGGGEVARNAAHGQRVPAIGRDADFHHGIVQPRPFGIGLAGGGAVLEFNDAVMIFAQAELACADQHAGTLHAADLADL